MRGKDWNDTVLEHPELEIADKLVYHLLVRFGGDDLPVRRQIAGLLQRSERHIRRVCVRLRQHGFSVDEVLEEAADDSASADTHVRERGHPCPEQRTSTSGADTHVRNNGPPCPKRTPMSDDADTHVRRDSYPHSARTPMSETDTHVRGNGHPCPARTPMSAPPTRTRTLWSSSSEEDSSCTAVPPSSSSSSPLPSSGEGRGGEGGLGGEKRPEEKTERKTPAGGEKKNTPGEETENTGEAKPRKIPPGLYLSQMQSWWDAICPDNLEEEIPWFGQLWEEFGEEIPVQALRQFAESRRTLEDLTYPNRFQRYFRTCCRNAQQGSPPPPEKPSSPSACRPSSNGDGRRRSVAEPSPEPAVRALPEKPSVPAPRWPSPPGNGHRWPSLPEGNGRPRPSLPEGNGRRPAVAESYPEPAADTAEVPGRTDFSAEEVQLKEDLVNHLATFWANQADTPPTRSADHFLASFRRERRRP